VALAFTVSGDIGDYTVSRLHEMAAVVAAAASVPISDVSMSIAPGSVVITVTIAVADSTQQQTVLQAVTSALDAPAEQASFFSSVSGGGVPIVEVTTETTSISSFIYPPGLPPTQPPNEGSDDTGAIIGGILGGVGGTFMCVMGYLVWKNSQKKKEHANVDIKTTTAVPSSQISKV